jgi:hypothetical protein
MTRRSEPLGNALLTALILCASCAVSEDGPERNSNTGAGSRASPVPPPT